MGNCFLKSFPPISTLFALYGLSNLVITLAEGCVKFQSRIQKEISNDLGKTHNNLLI